MCTPCGPMICYKYEESGQAAGGKAAGSDNRPAEGTSKDTGESKGIELRRIKSRELRGGVMYYSCHCIKRNGLQHDCRRTGCGGEPACLALPDPMCAPSQLARARGLADPAPLQAARPATGAGSGAQGSQGQGGKKFIVCELKGMTQQEAPAASSGTGKCCCCKSGGSGGGKGNAGAPPAGTPILLMKLN